MLGQIGVGKAKALERQDYIAAAISLGTEPAVIETIAQVESAGFGWDKQGRIKILFEKHVFYRELPTDRRAAAVKAGLARAKWVSPSRGGYKDHGTPEKRWALVEKAIVFDHNTAFRSFSMGTYQIMGFNAEMCGFKSAELMFGAFLRPDGEAAQLRAFCSYIVNKKLRTAVRTKNWDAIEKGYNGGGQGGAYARKMRAVYAKISASGKWNGWQTEKRTVVVTPVPRPPIQPSPLPVESPPRVGTGAALAAILAAVAAALWNWWDHVTSLFN